MINIGAYTKCSSEKIDYAIKYNDAITEFLQQETGQKVSFDEVRDNVLNLLK